MEGNFSLRMRSTRNIELIITSLVNTKLCFLHKSSGHGNPSGQDLVQPMKSCCICNVCERNLARGCMRIKEALAVENLSKIGQILPVFDENTLLWWSLASTPY